jgi:hypothetical protein
MLAVIAFTFGSLEQALASFGLCYALLAMRSAFTIFANMQLKTTYKQIVNTAKIASLNNNVNHCEIVLTATQENLSPAAGDKIKRLLLAIDIQNDFMEGIGSLPVPGSKGDVERLTKWIYSNIDTLTQIVCSLDTHSNSQIFHPCWWMDNNCNNPEPYTIITYNDLLTGMWTPVPEDKEPTYKLSSEYLKALEEAGKKQLCIWPYHCLTGSYGAELEAEFAKMVRFHSSARKSTPILLQKGKNRYSEMYGIIKPEYNPDNYINRDILDLIEQYDEIYIAGEAASHCVLESVSQIAEYFADRPEITDRITILKDCMSPIPGFEEATEEAFERLGIKSTTSS